MFRSIDAQTQSINHFIREIFGHLLAQKRNNHIFIARQNDVIDLFVNDNALQVLDYLFGVMQVIVFFVTLISRLGPSADLRVFGLYILDFILMNRLAGAKDKNLSAVGISPDARIVPVAFNQSGQWINLRTL